MHLAEGCCSRPPLAVGLLSSLQRCGRISLEDWLLHQQPTNTAIQGCLCRAQHMLNSASVHTVAQNTSATATQAFGIHLEGLKAQFHWH